jgi:oligosaccharide repeat unit polymerase
MATDEMGIEALAAHATRASSRYDSGKGIGGHPSTVDHHGRPALLTVPSFDFSYHCPSVSCHLKFLVTVRDIRSHNSFSISDGAMSSMRSPSKPLRTTILGRDGAFIVSAIILCVLVPGLLGGWQVASPAGVKGSVSLQDVITVWAGLRLAKLWARGEPRPFAIVFWLYVYVWLGLAGLLQVIHQVGPWPIAISSTAFAQAQIVILLGLAVLEIGHLFSAREVDLKQIRREIVGSRVTALVAFVLVTAPVWYQQLGGIHALISSRQELQTNIYGSGSLDLAGGGIKIALATVPTFLALYAVIVTRRYKLWKRRSRLVMALLVLVAVVLNSPIAMPRFWIATILTALVFATPFVYRRVAGTRLVIIGAVFVSIVLFPYVAYFRYTSGFKAPPGVVETLTTKGDYDSFQMVSAGVQYTRDAGFRYGDQLLGDLLFFVPRSVWSSKAQDTGTLIANHDGLLFTNLSAPLWIEMYIDFGYVGVAIMFFLYGTMMRRADDRFVKGDSPFAQFAIPLLAGYSCILLRGSLLQAMARLAIMLAIIWLISGRVKTTSSTIQPVIQ